MSSELDDLDLGPVTIEGPGLGENQRSYSKFVNLDMAKQVFYGLDIHRKGDEGYVNAFDIENNRNITER